MPKLQVSQSLDSIERIGGKLNYKDFRDFLKSIADAFPSGTEEYQFLTDLLQNEKTDLSFVRKLFSLLDEPPKISDTEPEGFSWELLSPSEVGKSVYKKIDEMDPQSARDLYEFMSYVFLNYSQSELEEDQPFKDSEPEREEPALKPEFKPADVADATEPAKPAVDQQATLPVPAFLKGAVKIVHTTEFPQFLEFFPTGLGMNADDFQKFTNDGPVITIEASNGAKLAWHKDVGFVNEQDDVLDPDAVQQLIGSDDFADLARQLPDSLPSNGPVDTGAADAPVEGASGTGPVQEEMDPEVLEGLRNGNDPDHISASVQSALPFNTPDTPMYDKVLREKTEARIRKMQSALHEGSVVQALRKDPDAPGHRDTKIGTILETKYNDENLPSSYATVLWSDGTRSEIPMGNIQKLLFNSLKDTAATMALVSSYKEVNGHVTFVLTGFKPASLPNTFTQLFAGRVELTKEQLKSAKISTKTRLYSGKTLATLFSQFATLEGSFAETKKVASAVHFGKTFVNERAAVIVKSGPYGMFAVKVPVVYQSGAKSYALFKKIGSSYVASSGHRFKAIMAARFNKPQYLMVAASAAEFFKVKGRVTCNANAVIERTQLILQRKAVRSAIVNQQKFAAIMSARRDAAAAQIASAKKEAEDAKKVTVNQSKMIDVLNARIVSDRQASVAPPSVKEQDQALVKQARVDRLVNRMSQF